MHLTKKICGKMKRLTKLLIVALFLSGAGSVLACLIECYEKQFSLAFSLLSLAVSCVVLALVIKREYIDYE